MGGIAFFLAILRHRGSSRVVIYLRGIQETPWEVAPPPLGGLSATTGTSVWRQEITWGVNGLDYLVPHNWREMQATGKKVVTRCLGLPRHRCMYHIHQQS